MNTTQNMMSRMTMPISVPPALHRPLPALAQTQLEKLPFQERGTTLLRFRLLLLEPAKLRVLLVDESLF